MQKWILAAIIVSVAAFAQAKPAKEVTLEKYIAQQKKNAEKKGREFDQAKVEKRFKKLDVNGDGKLTAEEKAAGSKKKKKAE